MSRRRVVAVVISAALVFLALILWGTANLWMVYATEDTKSRFLKSFDPTATVKGMVDVSSWGGGTGSSAGSRDPWHPRNVSHTSDFHWVFRPKPAQYPALLAALAGQARIALTGSQATITYEDLKVDRFTIFYRSGRSSGWIRADAPAPIEGPVSFVRLPVHIEESWSVRK